MSGIVHLTWVFATGACVGLPVGLLVGRTVGFEVGRLVGRLVGREVGLGVCGSAVGLGVGLGVLGGMWVYALRIRETTFEECASAVLQWIRANNTVIDNAAGIFMACIFYRSLK